ncbi:MAG: hypothetical protein GY941_16660, partial [Planctomycetes bacterium]|nr:hypothetical protein [Planctomycetota bacterium]
MECDRERGHAMDGTVTKRRRCTPGSEEAEQTQTETEQDTARVGREEQNE